MLQSMYFVLQANGSEYLVSPNVQFFKILLLAIVPLK